MKIPDFADKRKLFEWLIANKSDLIAAKKAEVKHADAVSYAIEPDAVDVVTKSEGGDNDDPNTISVLAVINTTNLMDSHDDVHLPGLWSKSLKENRNIMHLQEHQMAFDHIIASGKDLKAYTKEIEWRQLGANYAGKTEALLFESTIKRKRNERMFEEYKDGNVTNHSVGMIYVKIALAINDSDFKDEFAVWNKYIDQVANRKRAEDMGYFFAVTEAKVIEGSAVPLGSNWITPTLDNDLKSEPLQGTHDAIEPPQGTQLTSEEITKRISNFKIY
jgi:hypothetical protein